MPAAASAGTQLVEVHRVLAGDQRSRGQLADLGQLLGRRAPVGGRLLDAGRHLVLERGDADLEELVEVGRRDGAELGPFEQRDARARWRAASTRSLNASQLSSRLMNRSSMARLIDWRTRRRGPRRRGRPVSPSSGRPRSHSMRDQLALGVADDALAVAAELRVVARQQHEAGEHPGAELVEHRAVAPVAVDLPVRRHRTEVDDAGVGPGRLRSTAAVSLIVAASLRGEPDDRPSVGASPQRLQSFRPMHDAGGVL